MKPSVLKAILIAFYLLLVAPLLAVFGAALAGLLPFFVSLSSFLLNEAGLPEAWAATIAKAAAVISAAVIAIYIVDAIGRGVRRMTRLAEGRDTSDSAAEKNGTGE